MHMLKGMYAFFIIKLELYQTRSPDGQKARALGLQLYDRSECWRRRNSIGVVVGASQI